MVFDAPEDARNFRSYADYIGAGPKKQSIFLRFLAAFLSESDKSRRKRGKTLSLSREIVKIFTKI